MYAILFDHILIILIWIVDKYWMLEPGIIFIFCCNYSFKNWSNSAILFQIFHNYTNGLSFSSSFILNTEPIEQNLNSIFANKYDKRMETNKKKWILQAQCFAFCKYLFVFSQIHKYLVYHYSYLSYLINEEWFLSLLLHIRYIQSHIWMAKMNVK